MSIPNHAGGGPSDFEVVPGGATPPQAGTVTVRLPAGLADWLRDGADIGVERIRTSRSVVVAMGPAQRAAALERLAGLAGPGAEVQSSVKEDAMRAQAAIASAVRHAAADADSGSAGALRPRRSATRPAPLEELGAWLTSCRQSLGELAAAHQTTLELAPAGRGGEIVLHLRWVGLDGQPRAQRMLLDRNERPEGLSDIVEVPWPKDIVSWAQRARVLQGARRAREAMAATRLLAERFERSLETAHGAADDELAAAVRRGHPAAGELAVCWEPCIRIGDAPGAVTVGYRSVDRPGDVPEMIAHRDLSEVAPDRLCMALLGRAAIVAADPVGPGVVPLGWMWRKTLRNAPVPGWVRDDAAATSISRHLCSEARCGPGRQRGMSL